VRRTSVFRGDSLLLAGMQENAMQSLLAGNLNMHGYLPVDPVLRRVQAAETYLEE
jgi:hypothetical protein